MRARRPGHVMNITSVAGHVGFVGSGCYAASKHAVEGFSESLAVECAPFGVRVTCVAPGPFRTDFAGRSLRQTVPAFAEYKATAGARLAGARKGTARRALSRCRTTDATYPRPI